MKMLIVHSLCKEFSSLFLFGSPLLSINNWVIYIWVRVQVDDDDGFYDGPDESEYGTDDSNGINHINSNLSLLKISDCPFWVSFFSAEDNPCNDYPDEETSEEEDELESEDTSGDEAEELKTESSSDGSPESKELLHHEHLDDADDPLEVDNCDDAYFDDNFYDDDNYGYDSPNDTENEDWWWAYEWSVVLHDWFLVLICPIHQHV